jgi:hypothetical protein
MLNFFPPGVKLAFAVGALILIGLALNWTYDRIYDHGYQAAAVVYEQKAIDQKAANDRAITAADKGLREDMAALALDKEKLENDVARLNAEAAKDPDAASGGVKRSSVQRLNAVR